jgi:hypothetical protein
MTVAEAAPPADNGTRTFPFRMTRNAKLLFWPWGLGIRPTEAVLGPDTLQVRFGWFEATIKIADITRFEIQGPFNWLRAITIRHTWFTQDISYCTDGRGAVVLYLSSARHLAFVRNVSQMYVGIEDLDGLADALRGRGIEGEDKRRPTA